MKKIILFLAVLAFGNSFGQTMTIYNNTMFNTITVEYREMDCNGAVNLITTPPIPPGGSYGPATISAGYTHFPWADSYETSTGIPQNTYLLTGMLPNTFFPNCGVSGPIFTSGCNYTQFCTANWTEIPITPSNGKADVIIEYNP